MIINLGRVVNEVSHKTNCQNCGAPIKNWYQTKCEYCGTCFYSPKEILSLFKEYQKPKKEELKKNHSRTPLCKIVPG